MNKAQLEFESEASSEGDELELLPSHSPSSSHCWSLRSYCLFRIFLIVFSLWGHENGPNSLMVLSLEPAAPAPVQALLARSLLMETAH